MLTPFQRNYIQQLSQRPDFKHFGLDYLNDDYEKERIFPVLFFTIDGKVHAHRLGKKRVLQEVVSN